MTERDRSDRDQDAEEDDRATSCRGGGDEDRTGSVSSRDRGADRAGTQTTRAGDDRSGTRRGNSDDRAGTRRGRRDRDDA